MGFMDSLRRAQAEGTSAARNVLSKAEAELEDAERRLRQKMRIHPAPTTNGASAAAAVPAEEPEGERKAIVSIHGEDVKETELPPVKKSA